MLITLKPAQLLLFLYLWTLFLLQIQIFPIAFGLKIVQEKQLSILLIQQMEVKSIKYHSQMSKKL